MPVRRAGEQPGTRLKRDPRSDDHCIVTATLPSRRWAAMPLGELRDAQQELGARIRRAEHWRRLVAARLDLAVAAVTDIEDLAPQDASRPWSSATGPEAHEAPSGLRLLLGIDRPEQRLCETSILPVLKETLTALDAHLATLHRCVREADQALGERLDCEAASHRARRWSTAV